MRLKFQQRSADTEGGIVQSHDHHSPIDPPLIGICERFHRAVSHLTQRRRGKESFVFSDEYDVQDVFGAVIKCRYDDVVDEEYAPSFAGGCARVDFVIADIETAVELKRGRSKQDIADELIVDIAHYITHPLVKKLVCFIYDPDGVLRRDASQIERDLSGYHEHKGKRLEVVVLIRPK